MTPRKSKRQKKKYKQRKTNIRLKNTDYGKSIRKGAERGLVGGKRSAIEILEGKNSYIFFLP